MKKLFKTLIAFFVFTLNGYSQAPVRDRWDTLYANVDYLNTTSYLYQTANMPVGNNMVILSDSINTLYSASYLQYFNTSNNTLSSVNYTRLFHDMGTYGGAAYTTTTANLSYVFFGPKTYSFGVSDFGFYKYNTLTNAVTTETVSLASYDNNGIANMGFYSPTTNHDSLIIFVRATLVSNDSIYIYKKHYNQAGVINSNVKLPVQLQYITKTFIFNNTLYVAGYTNANDGRLLKSNDGLTYTVITNFESNYPLNSVVDMDTLNNKLYLGLKPTDGNTGYKIIETADGNNFTSLISNTNGFDISSLKNYKKTIWFSYHQAVASKQADNNQNTMSLNYKAPYVGYLKLSSSAEEMSIDTLGRLLNQGETFKLQKVNNKLLLVGNYYDDGNGGLPGNFIYQFIPPISNFTISTPNICLNTPKTFVSQSTAADSVRWFVDNNYTASTNTVFAYTFGTAGNHTLGLIAISGTQKDTLKYTINVYSVTVNNTNSFNSCIHNTTTINPSIPGAIAPISYTWSIGSGLNSSSISGSTISLSTNASGSYTYFLTIKDVNNCSAYGPTNTITIGSNKDITGVVTVTATPLTSGSVTLYKYEPILTRFDSITTQPLNATGTFTFSNQDAFTYILKCEPTSLNLENTYAPSETSWKTAIQVAHGCITSTSQNIAVVPLTNIGTRGILSGKITEGIGFQPRGGTFAPGAPISGLSIKGGRNPGGNIVAQGKSNSAGEYTLSNMPISGTGETYFILVDVPGLDTNTTYHVAITTSSLQYNDLNFIVDSAKINPTMIMGIRNFELNNSSIKVYPNPTNGLINIIVDLHSPEQITIKLIDITGREAKSILSTTTFNDTMKLKTDIGNLPEGVYFLKVKIGDAEQAIKIVITN